MKRYYLSINKGNVEIFNLDDSKNNFFKRLEKLKTKYKSIQELTLDDETKEIISKYRWLKIKPQHIKYLLYAVTKKLWTNDLADNVKNTFLKTYKKNPEINPILVLLFKSNKTIVDILRLLDFPNKNIIIEILQSQKDNKQKYEDIKRIQEIEYMTNKMKNKISSIISFWVMMIIAVIWIGIGFKIYLVPKVISFMAVNASAMGMTNDVSGNNLTISIISNYFFIWVIILISIVLMLWAIRLISKKTFFWLMLKLPAVWPLIRKQNNINILMLYSFYNTNANEFYNKLKQQYPNLDLDFYWADIAELVSKTFNKSEEQFFWASIFDINIVDTIETLSSVSNPDKQIKMEIDMYVDDLQEYIAKIQKIMFWIIMTIVVVSVFSIMYALFSVMTELPAQMKKMQDASWM